MKIDLHRIAQAREYVGIILESRRQLAQLLVFLRRQFAAFGHMTVYMLHTEAAQVEAHAQIARRKNIVHVGNSREVLRNKSAVEGVKPCHAPVFALQIGTHEAHIRSQPLEKGRAKGRLSTVMRKSGYWRASELTTGTSIATSPWAENRIIRRWSVFIVVYLTNKLAGEEYPLAILFRFTQPVTRLTLQNSGNSANSQRFAVIFYILYACTYKS